jgi:hypothetical protein
MSAQNDFAQAVAMLSSLNTISQSTHGSGANLEYLQNALFARISSMVSNNRREALLQQDAIQRAQLDAIREHAQRRALQQRLTATTTPIPVSGTISHNPRYNPLEKTKVVSKSKLEETIDCAICQESPKVKDCILTDCGHHYCKTCWNGWMNAERSNKKCPTCRKEMPRITSFKARASSKRPAAPARPLMIIEDDEIVSHMSETIDSF